MGHFDFDTLIVNPGLQLIAVNIFKNLDIRTLSTCRIVSNLWKNFIDNDRNWWRKLLKCDKILHYDSNVRQNYPEIFETLDYISQKETLDNLKLFGYFILDYLGNQGMTKFDTFLHYAAHRNRFDIFDLLIKTPTMTSLNIKNVKHNQLYGTLLGNACIANQLEVLDFFMNLQGPKKIDFNQTVNGFTLFHEACNSGNVEIVKLFLKNADTLQIDLNVPANNGRTPFMYSKSQVLPLLLSDERIDVNAVDYKGETLLSEAFSCYEKGILEVNELG